MDASSDPYAVEVPAPVGVSLSELEAMVIDPFEELRKAGIEITIEEPYGLTPSRGSCSLKNRPTPPAPVSWRGTAVGPARRT
jgi:hypothetical protein